MRLFTRWFIAISLLLILGWSVWEAKLETSGINPPTGVRPCCAFGQDLKAKVGAIPVPFFSLDNVLSITEIGNHRYNDGSSSVVASLLGLSEEKNGLLFSAKGGFIDTAHVRDTADYTYYLFQTMLQHLGTDKALDLPAELKNRRIQWLSNDTPLTAREKTQLSADAAALLAFQLAQWHEIAQWFGMVSVVGFTEYASAFSAEDLYSNMLGAHLAHAIILAKPDIQLSHFNRAMDAAFHQKMQTLEVQSSAITTEKMAQLDGVWWDSSQRLPDKWAVILRDYNLGLQLLPHYPTAKHRLTLIDHATSGLAISQWVRLELHPAGNERVFDSLPSVIRTQKVWTVAHFQLLADFAKQQDERERES